MSLKKSFGKLLICVVLEIGALSGVPMRPEEIARLMEITKCSVGQVMKTDLGDGKREDRTVPDR